MGWWRYNGCWLGVTLQQAHQARTQAGSTSRFPITHHDDSTVLVNAHNPRRNPHRYSFAITLIPLSRNEVIKLAIKTQLNYHLNFTRIYSSTSLRVV